MKSTFSATRENFRKMVDFIITGLTEQKFEKKLIGKIHLVVEEIILNIIQHAYPEGPGDVEIDYCFETRNEKVSSVTLTISDWGVPFNPLTAASEPVMDVEVEERKVGGLGVFLVKNLVDELSYEHKGNQNRLTLKTYCK